MNESFRSAVAAAADDQQIPVIVQYRSDEARTLSNRRAPAGVLLGESYDLIPAQAVLGSPAGLKQLADDPAVQNIWLDLPVHTMLDVSVSHVRAPQLWNLGFEGEGIVVAIVDTGIDPEHPDFEGRIVAVKDFTGTRPDAGDGNGHGTHVASTVAGSGAASGGKYIGVAPDARLLVAKVLRDDGGGATSQVMAGVDWAVKQGAHVINLSLGADVACDGTDAMSAICDAAVDAGAVVCVAAGNAGPNPGTVGSPGCVRKGITIGATTDADKVTSFSSRGPTKDGRVKPDVCFPGHNIVAARARGTAMGTPVNEFYTSASGTSMATPHASGAAAVLLQAFPGITPAAVKERLMRTAVDLALDPNTQGSGRADILAAHGYVPVPVPTPTPTPTPVPTPVPPLVPTPPPTPEPPPPPPPGGCLTFGQGTRGAGGTSTSPIWIVLGLLLVLCILCVCLMSVLTALGLGTSGWW